MFFPSSDPIKSRRHKSHQNERKKINENIKLPSVTKIETHHEDK